MPLPPLSPGVSIFSGPFLPALLLLALLFGLGAGTSTISGDFMFLGGASTTIGVAFSGALVLGARLLLLALDGATDIMLTLFACLLGAMNVSEEDMLERGEVLACGERSSLLEVATSAWSSHLRTRWEFWSDVMTPDFE
jgi:hypothetical protein